MSGSQGKGQQEKFKAKDQRHLPGLCPAGKGKNPDLSVIAAGFHGVIEGAGAPESQKENSSGHLGEGAEGRSQVMVSQAGLLGGGDGRGCKKKQEEIPVDQQHKLQNKVGYVELLPQVEKIRGRRAKSQEIQAGDGRERRQGKAKACQDPSSLPVRYQLPMGRAKAFRGVRERLTITAALQSKRKKAGILRRSRYRERGIPPRRTVKNPNTRSSVSLSSSSTDDEVERDTLDRVLRKLCVVIIIIV